MSDFDKAVEAFRKRWGFDPTPAIERITRLGGWEIEGGTEEERAFLRDLLAGKQSCGYCLGERCPCTCEDDCGARPGRLPDGVSAMPGDAATVWCPSAEGYVDWLRKTGMYSEAELARMTEQGHR